VAQPQAEPVDPKHDHANGDRDEAVSRQHEQPVFSGQADRKRRKRERRHKVRERDGQYQHHGEEGAGDTDDGGARPAGQKTHPRRR